MGSTINVQRTISHRPSSAPNNSEAVQDGDLEDKDISLPGTIQLNRVWIPGARKGQLSDQYLLVGRTGIVELSLQGAFVAVMSCRRSMVHLKRQSRDVLAVTQGMNVKCTSQALPLDSANLGHFKKQVFINKCLPSSFR